MSHLMPRFFSGCASACLALALAIGAGAQQSSPATNPPQQKPESKPSTAAPTTPEKPAEKHSTPEDRQRLVAIAHKLEASPLDPTLGPDRSWAVSWVVAAPDVPVRLCTTLLSDLRRPKYKYRPELSSQLLISSAAFVIEHPDKSSDNVAQSLGGMEGVLKAYTAILKTDPQATAASLNEYLQKQKEGKLTEAIREKVKDCQ
jgi:hypothetical protein